ncbi:MAG TPA: class I SAM-dependent methyltransferase [Saprospiraceae bacterium]|jgi:2-polyprenyl-3-methyl-5-hydroxy-6-metoxy-1,4-benzoquinol methylase|nr:class I SAM-dependent methyltransferase [Saprospiraceae bacterium]HRO07351.1 class I SAM-dependent methyltransferase [Saprospiraceae bacterium]HRP40634.1 class I SAM-dependent methyltransferase [Saprospiraceae bacterium]
MQDRHSNRDQYFKEQEYTTEKYVIPFINDILRINNNISVLEIGCGEGGNLVPFMHAGCNPVVGIDMSVPKIEAAKVYFSKFEESNVHVRFLCADIYELTPEKLGTFDVIFLRDVIEHIHDQDKFMGFMHTFMKPESIAFFGFPNWYMPFGGHQQICKSKILSKTPYFHILPNFIYKRILKLFGESEATIESLLEIKSTGITIERFEKILRKNNYTIVKKAFFFINPNYEVKFGLRPRLSSGLISSVPWIRNFFITANYYIVSHHK